MAVGVRAETIGVQSRPYSETIASSDKSSFNGLTIEQEKVALQFFGIDSFNEPSNQEAAIRYRQSAAKKGVERFTAGVILMTASPLIVASAAAIWSIDKRSPFFNAGYEGMDKWKTRTFVFNAEQLQLQNEDPDVPYTELKQCGKIDKYKLPGFLPDFLRRSSADELIQLLTILQGGMSIFGPRLLGRHEYNNLENLINPENARRYKWNFKNGVIQSGGIAPHHFVDRGLCLEGRVGLDLELADRESAAVDLRMTAGLFLKSKQVFFTPAAR